MVIRKLLVTVEDMLLEMGRPVAPPLRRAVAMAVIGNPFAGRYVEDLSELVETGEKLGALLAERAIAVLGVPGRAVHSFGKAALVGEAGELEHAAALLHPKFGAPHFDAIEARVTDAPMRDEILVCLALTTGGRPLPRVGGLAVEDIKGEDGLR